jgi:hypothetical protein
MSPLFVAWILMLHSHFLVTMFEDSKNRDKQLKYIVIDAIAFVGFMLLDVMTWRM